MAQIKLFSFNKINNIYKSTPSLYSSCWDWELRGWKEVGVGVVSLVTRWILSASVAGGVRGHLVGDTPPPQPTRAGLNKIIIKYILTNCWITAASVGEYSNRLDPHINWIWQTSTRCILTQSPSKGRCWIVGCTCPQGWNIDCQVLLFLAKCV